LVLRRLTGIPPESAGPRMPCALCGRWATHWCWCHSTSYEKEWHHFQPDQKEPGAYWILVCKPSCGVNAVQEWCRLSEWVLQHRWESPTFLTRFRKVVDEVMVELRGACIRGERSRGLEDRGGAPRAEWQERSSQTPKHKRLRAGVVTEAERQERYSRRPQPRPHRGCSESRRPQPRLPPPLPCLRGSLRPF